MACFVIWIDRSCAKIFHVPQGDTENTILKSHFPEHHTHRLDNIDQAQREKKLFQSVVENLSPENQFLILGPGVVKFHFLNYLNEHYPLLSKKVVGCETVDHPTDPQIGAHALKFFKLGDPSVA